MRKGQLARQTKMELHQLSGVVKRLSIYPSYAAASAHHIPGHTNLLCQAVGT